jgi:hypothetical protein
VAVKARLRRCLALGVVGALAALGVGAAAAQGDEIRALCSHPGVPAQPAADCGAGWYTSDVTLQWAWSPGATATKGCDVTTLSIDTAGTPFTCTVSWGPTSTIARTATLRLDKTPPVIAPAIPSRPPNRRGWYRSPVGVSFRGSDATSGIAFCTSARYAGPDAPAATVVGACVDQAGHRATAGFRLAYDASPPTLSGVRAQGGDGVALLRWRAAADAVSCAVVRLHGRGRSARTTVYKGRGRSFRDTRLSNRARYRYLVIARDSAGNERVRSVTVVPGPRLLGPGPGASVRRPPMLAWSPVRRASYYNVQLYAQGKVLTAWPRHARMRLPRTWRYAGRSYRLRPGRYRWYVWPGFGRRSDRQYGHLIGTRTFVVRRARAR